jgi:hypothetical protein
MKIPPDWTPGHPGYPLHLARTQLRAAAGLAERLLDMLDVPNGRQIIARALWDGATTSYRPDDGTCADELARAAAAKEEAQQAKDRAAPKKTRRAWP